MQESEHWNLGGDRKTVVEIPSPWNAVEIEIGWLDRHSEPAEPRGDCVGQLEFRPSGIQRARRILVEKLDAE